MIFKAFYDRCMSWAEHKHRERYLVGVSIFESFIFPLPTALLMIPMVIATPNKWVRLATITTIMSVAGALIGYFLGYFAISIIEPWVIKMGWWDQLLMAKAEFDTHGVWAVTLGAVTPAPFKLFTITAGILSMNLLSFFIAALIGRAIHFYMIAGLMAWAGPKMEATVRRYIEWLGWGLVLIVIIGYAYHKLA